MKIFSRAAGFFLLLALIVTLALLLGRSPQHNNDKAAIIPEKIDTDHRAPLTHSSRSGSLATNLPPVKSADEKLKAFRRDFRAAPRVVGTPSAGDLPVMFEGFHIFTSAQPKLALHPGNPSNSTYIVQFNGPVEASWKQRIEHVGGHIHGYIPHHALSVTLDARAAKRLSHDSFVRAIFPYIADYKIQPFLQYLTSLNDPSLPEKFSVTLSTYRPGDVDAVTRFLFEKSIAVEGIGSGARWGWIRARIPLHALNEIAANDQVQWVEEFVPPRIVNDQSVIGTHLNVTNVWSARGLTGAGQIIGHADTGLDVGNTNSIHPDFAGRIVAAFALGRTDTWNDPDGHGTHTAGSILGNGAASSGQFRGVAYEAGLVHQSVLDSGGGLGGLPVDLNDLFLQAYNQGARIHADSWGSSVYGFYTGDSRQADEFMWDYPEMLLVFAAGNDGWDSGDGIINPDSIGSPATAKNILSVGASESGREPGSGGLSSRTWGSLWPWDYSASPIYEDYVSQSYDLTNQGMAAFSSRGPSDDNRIKPEVVAPGTDIISTRSQQSGAGLLWGAHPNSQYSFSGGTSMSTPLVAGAAALVRQYFAEYKDYNTPSAALIKAALMHGARTLTPGQYGAGAYREIPPDRPNAVEGFGQVDVEGTLFPSSAAWFYADEKGGLANPEDAAEHVFYAQTGTVKITMNYTDFPATAGSGIKLVNDLDLIVDAEARRDRRNPFEHAVLNVMTPGFYTARVEAINIPNGPQPYAMVISGPVIEAPRIEHVPLQNQFETNQPYRVRARVIASSPVAENAVAMFWRTSPETNFARITMMHATNDVYEGSIPAQTNPSLVEYYIAASNEVFVVRDPASAPASVYSFLVTRSFNLVVAGVPAAIYEVNPPYGTNRIAQGNAILLSAPGFTNITPGVRVAIDGWTGTGSVPAEGFSNAVSVVITNDSSISWRWVTQYALTQTSSLAGLISTVSWHNAWTSASTLAAEPQLEFNAAHYGLAGWRVDGARYPNAGASGANPASGITMFGPRQAEAVYLPAAQDTNSNKLPDWWEQFYFGTNIAVSNVDSDDDGFTNIKEYQDRTDPRDPSSAPQPPSITHVPLANPQGAPAPWMVLADIEDNYAVSNAVLFWQRNGGAWTSAVMIAGASNVFSSVIPAPGTNGNAFAYRLEALDYAGLKASTGPYLFNVAYPRLRAAPENFGVIDLLAQTSTNVVISITNAGIATLSWTMSRALFFDHIENGTNQWSHAGQNDVWNIGGGRFVSAANSWHFGNGPYGNYPDNAHAWLDMAPVNIHAPAMLIFEHWARMEYDEEQVDDHYWDGAVVEVSTNDGIHFEMIEPVGGYPHRITDNPASPFAPDTPCYGETIGWETAMFDLSDFVGESVRVRFRFGSDGYVTEEGWYIDNVRIVYKDESSWNWLSSAETGSVAAQTASNLTISLNSSALDYGERRSAVFVMESNDPEQRAPFLVPLEIHNASRQIIVSSSAQGRVYPEGSVLLRYGDDLEVQATADVFCVIYRVMTNDAIASGYELLESAMVTWTNIQSNGTLHVDFGDKMILGWVPARWLYEEGFTNASFEIEAATDHDGDGMLTWQEYLAETDAMASTSVAVKIIGALPDQTNFVISWISFTNQNIKYLVESTTNLSAGFLPIATNLSATPPVNIYTNVSTNPSQAIRVRHQ